MQNADCGTKERGEAEKKECSACPSGVRFAVLGWLCAAAAFAYISRNAIAVAESTVRGDLGLTKEQSGWLMSAFFISYAVFQIPGAWVGQRFGARRALSVFAIAWSVATAAMAAGWIFMLIVARVAKGLAQAGLFPVSTGVIANWFPKTGRAFATGALASFMSVGGAAGAALTGWLVVTIDWRSMFMLYSLPGLLWAAWFWKYFRNTPQEHGSVSAAERRLIEGEGAAGGADESSPPATAQSPAPPTPWLQLVTSPAMWCICAQQFFRAAGYMFFTSWFATYLQEARGVTITTSGVLTMLPLLSVVAGSLAGGVISDAVLRHTGSLRLARRAVACCSLVLCAALTLSAYFFADALAAVLIISAGSFFAAIAAPCGYTITIDMGGEHVPTVHSVMNMSGNVGAMLFPLAVPWLLRETGSWNAVLFSFSALYLAAALCWLCLKPEGNVFAQALWGKR
jgi:MFS transporter, ACS family, D-galactonate transporter